MSYTPEQVKALKSALAMIRACVQGQEVSPDIYLGPSRPDEIWEGEFERLPMEEMGNPEAYRNLDEETTSWSG